MEFINPSVTSQSMCMRVYTLSYSINIMSYIIRVKSYLRNYCSFFFLVWTIYWRKVFILRDRVMIIHFTRNANCIWNVYNDIDSVLSSTCKIICCWKKNLNFLYTVVILIVVQLRFLESYQLWVVFITWSRLMNKINNWMSFISTINWGIVSGNSLSHSEGARVSTKKNTDIASFQNLFLATIK